MSAIAAEAIPPRAVSLTRLIPLTGRRRSLIVVRLVPLLLIVGGIAGVVTFGRSSSWTGLLSLVLPGLGQVVAGRTVLGVIVLLLGLFAWVYAIMRSGGWLLLLLAPWAGLDAGSGGQGWAVPVGLLASACAIGTIEVGTRTWRDRRISQFRRVAAESDAIGSPAAVPAHATQIVSAPAPALDRNHEAYLRYFMKFGHSDPTDWTVFDDPKHVDSELRYQLVLAAWNAFHFQYQYTPAYRQAASIALTNLSERGRDHRVWGYTPKENLKGLRIDPDPFERENVMYSGYIANVISMHRAMTGDDRYDRPGGYAVTDGKRTFDWNHSSIIEQLAVQHGASPFGSISCFPGWIFPACQTFSLRALQLYDVVHGTDHSFAVDRYLDAFERYFVNGQGEVVTCRHVTGFKHPIDPLIVGVTAQAATGLFTAAFSPEAVEANYRQQVRARMEQPDENGRICLRLSKMDTYDTSYGWNPGMPYSFALAYAAEVGDTDVIDGLRLSLEDMLTPDGPRPGPGSLLSMAVTMMALGNSEHGLSAGHRQAPAGATTPELSNAPYPQVIVSRAVTNGRGVTVDLLPGPAADGPVSLTFSRMAPSTEHVVVADGVEVARSASTADGDLIVDHHSGRRLRLDVQPAA